MANTHDTGTLPPMPKITAAQSVLALLSGLPFSSSRDQYESTRRVYYLAHGCEGLVRQRLHHNFAPSDVYGDPPQPHQPTWECAWLDFAPHALWTSSTATARMDALANITDSDGSPLNPADYLFSVAAPLPAYIDDPHNLPEFGKLPRVPDSHIRPVLEFAGMTVADPPAEHGGTHAVVDVQPVMLPALIHWCGGDFGAVVDAAITTWPELAAWIPPSVHVRGLFSAGTDAAILATYAYVSTGTGDAETRAGAFLAHVLISTALHARVSLSVRRAVFDTLDPDLVDRVRDHFDTAFALSQRPTTFHTVRRSRVLFDETSGAAFVGDIREVCHRVLHGLHSMGDPFDVPVDSPLWENPHVCPTVDSFARPDTPLKYTAERGKETVINKGLKITVGVEKALSWWVLDVDNDFAVGGYETEWLLPHHTIRSIPESVLGAVAAHMAVEKDAPVVETLRRLTVYSVLLDTVVGCVPDSLEAIASAQHQLILHAPNLAPKISDLPSAGVFGTQYKSLLLQSTTRVQRHERHTRSRGGGRVAVCVPLGGKVVRAAAV